MTPEPIWRCGRHVLTFKLPLIMAIINLTPDSFSGDGLAGSAEAAKHQAERALAEGAGILDLGGESSRPGSESVSVQEELDRVIPAVEATVAFGVPVSVDTVKPEVMRAAIAAGATIINDINALREPGAIEAVAASDAGVCLMHMQGQPRTMQAAPGYADVYADVEAFLLERAGALKAAGVDASRICLDPGFGFGKALEHNLSLFRDMSRLKAQGYPLLVGVSRKTMLGGLTGRPVNERIIASVTAAVLAAQRGADIIRVHDVAATRDALAVWAGIDREMVGAY